MEVLLESINTTTDCANVSSIRALNKIASSALTASIVDSSFILFFFHLHHLSSRRPLNTSHPFNLKVKSFNPV